jgi:hypothetical protein
MRMAPPSPYGDPEGDADEGRPSSLRLFLRRAHQLDLDVAGLAEGRSSLRSVSLLSRNRRERLSSPGRCAPIPRGQESLSQPPSIFILALTSPPHRASATGTREGADRSPPACRPPSRSRWSRPEKPKE